MVRFPGSDGAGYAGSVFILGYITGVLALAGAVVGLVNENLMAMALCLVAAALAVGLLANAALRQ
jgi:hypothetical protein